MTIPRTFLVHHLSRNKKALFPSLLLALALISATGAHADQRSPSAADKQQGQDGQVADNSRSEPLTFVQITDVHLFDEGKKRDSRAEYDRDQQDNRDALRWAVEQINQLVSHGRNIDFAVFTGDFGLELVRRTDGEVPCNLSDKDKKDFDKYKQQGWPRFVSMRDAANEVALEFSRLHVSTIYVLPGNNDLVGEDPCDLGRYTDFVQQVTKAMPKSRARLVDLLNPANAQLDWNGFRVVGLNSASFKSADNVNAQQAIKHLSDTIPRTQGAQYLIFTHIPDLEDPYTHQPSWNAVIDRDVWGDIAKRPDVAGIFAGHFHSAERLLYAAPGQEIRSPSVLEAAAKTWVAPPLAIKAQDDKLETARGFLLVRVQPTTSAVATSATPFWYGGSRLAMCWCYVLPVLSVLAALAFLIWAVRGYVVVRKSDPGIVRDTHPTVMTLTGLAAIAFAVWMAMRFMIDDLGLYAMYWASPIFGAIGGIFGGLGDGNIFTLASYEDATKIKAGILGDVVSGIGGSIAVVFLSERTLNLQPGSPDSLLWLMSVSFVAGVAGKRLVQTALERFLKQQELKKEISAIREDLQKATTDAAEAKRVAGEALGKTGDDNGTSSPSASPPTSPGEAPEK